MFIPYACVYIESIDCIFFPSLALNVTLLPSPVYKLCFSLLSRCFDLNTILLFFYKFFMIFS